MPVAPTLSPAELEARLRLHALPELGPRRFHRLLEAFGSASAALSAPAAAWRSLGLPAACAEPRRDASIREQAAEVLHWLEAAEHHLVMWDAPGYPALLAELGDAPPLLFLAGAPNLLERPQLAMVGSRRASPAGLDTARSLRAQPGAAAASSSPVGWPWASMVPPTKVRWRPAARPSPSWAQAWSSLYPRRHLGAGEAHRRARRRRDFRTAVEQPAPACELPPAQPHHQWPLAGHPGGGGQSRPAAP